MACSPSDTAERGRALAAAAVLAALVAGPTFVCASPQSAAEEYPSDITPPAGTRYPCALTPLPRSLPGIPEGDRSYVNRAYTRILRATQAKLVLLKALEDGSDVPAALARYQDATRRLAEQLAAERAPSGLAPFQEDVLQALALQQAFFAKAAPLRQSGSGMADVYRIAEGRQASARLISAWGKMQGRYPSWAPETKDSIYHHLCALDLF
jgi:hypothetical protein